MSNVRDFAEKEIDILIKSSPDPNNRPIIEPFKAEILALVEKFGKSGQSGGSAPFTAAAISQAVKSLCLFEPICPLTGEAEEWAEFEGMVMNKRCNALFKDQYGAKYVDAIVWRTQKGATWSGAAKLSYGSYIRSSQYIKSFPFKPKTFIIDVIEEEIEKDNWEFYVKDEAQLSEVFEYYKKVSK
jgi:hypothetical protein